MNRVVRSPEARSPTSLVERPRGSEIAERVIAHWLGPDESVASAPDGASELRAKVAALVAEIPAGRWTSYGEVAIVAGTYAQPLAAILASHPVPNAWRVLQSGGTVSPGFRWSDPNRHDEPLDLLASEGVRFDPHGRAAPEQFFAADELASALGLEVDAAIAAERARRRAGSAASPGASDLGADQRAFYDRLKDYGRLNALHIKRWRKALLHSIGTTSVSGTPASTSA
ncbi:MGMT family protein [Demequina rhizosphaerae]|uniref:MGMT family protein n=1 Tax=Demequina rhizosphaerae TaxID=1638985 RepID=UPI00155DB570|nr:MGMT family protein [Demequina rhizosphaerae]